MFNVKKFSLSLAFIVTFFGYVFRSHFGGDEGARQIGNTLPPLPSASGLPSTLPTLPAANSPTARPTIFPTTTTTPTTRPTIAPTATPTATPVSKVKYRDGSYVGSVADAFYGNIQVKAIVQGGRLTDVQFLQYPNDRSTSIEINQQADPMLAQEAIQAQSANVDIISGATDSSIAFQQSLGTALRAAQ
jgi:uncharacterized protein with FMN-binding domain